MWWRGEGVRERAGGGDDEGDDEGGERGKGAAAP